MYVFVYTCLKIVCTEILYSVMNTRVCTWYIQMIEVVIGRGPTAVKFFMRLWLQKFVSPVRPQPRVRVMARVSTTKHQHKPNQQKLTTQIKQPKIKLQGY